MNERKRAVNLLEGGIVKALSRLAFPIMVSALLQMAYNLVDMIWIGRLGYQPVAAVGAAGLYIWVADGMLMFSRVGSQVYVGQELGAKHFIEARRWAVAGLQFTVLVALTTAAVEFLLAPSLIGFFQFETAQTTAQGVTYLRIYVLGYVFSYLVRVLTSLVTVGGESHLSLWANAVGLILNIILDPLCIFVLGWGVAGAAIATIFSQAVVFLVFLFMSRRMPLLKRLPLRRFEPWRYVKIFKLGVPTALQTMIYAGISIVIGRLVSSFGDGAMSVQKVGSQVESISWMSAEGFAVALTAFMAQNFGAGKWHRTRQGFYRAFLLMGSVGLFSTVVLYFFPEIIFRLFIQDPTVLPAGVSYLQILAISQMFMCWEIMCSAAFSGLGKTLPPALIIVTLTAARIPLAYFLTQTSLGVDGIWWAITVSSIAKGVVLLLLFELYLRRLLAREERRIP